MTSAVPIIKDKWWFWGAYGKTDVRILKLAGSSDKTLLKNVSFKTQGQVTSAMRASFTYFNANKLKWGRGAGSLRPQETTYDQTGPNDMYKGEVNYVLGSNLFLVGRYAHVKGGFAFQPEGGFDNVQVWRDASYVWHGSYNNYLTDRPQDAFNVDANYFHGNQEFKFGYSWRKTEVHSTSEWPNDYSTYFNYGPGEAPIMTVNVAAVQPSDGGSKYQSFYAGDTITLDRATVSLGVRFDHQTASVLPSSSPASMAPGAAAFLPAMTAPGVANAIKQNVIQPRIGINYALDESRKTQLRATYSMFTDQIGSGTAGFLSVAQYPVVLRGRHRPERQPHRRSQRVPDGCRLPGEHRRRGTTAASIRTTPRDRPPRRSTRSVTTARRGRRRSSSAWTAS